MPIVSTAVSLSRVASDTQITRSRTCWLHLWAPATPSLFLISYPGCPRAVEHSWTGRFWCKLLESSSLSSLLEIGACLVCPESSLSPSQCSWFDAQTGRLSASWRICDWRWASRLKGESAPTFRLFLLFVELQVAVDLKHLALVQVQACQGSRLHARKDWW